MGKTNIRAVSTYSTANYQEQDGIDTFVRNKLNGIRKTFHGEIGEIGITAISDRERIPDLPVDIVLEKNNPGSWGISTNRQKTKIIESDEPTMIFYHYEGGLIPDFNKNGEVIGSDGPGYLNMIRETEGVPNVYQFVQMHTVKSAQDASPNHIRNVRGFGKHADGLIVMINDAKKILTKAPFNIPARKIHVIPHGLRENNESEEETKKRIGIPLNQVIVSQPGLQSLNKGNDLFIRGGAKFIHESLTPVQRKRFAILLPGTPHPNFVKQEGGKYYAIWQENMERTIRESNLKVQDVEYLEEADFVKYDLIIMKKFISDTELMSVYSLSAGICTPYPFLDQAASGAGADCEGPGTPLISTKTRWARETLNPYNKTSEKGMIITDRGILIDNDKNCVDQMARSLDYLTFKKDENHKFERLNMGEVLYHSGLSKRWGEVARDYYKLIQLASRGSDKNLLAGFKRVKTSTLEYSIK